MKIPPFKRPKCPVFVVAGLGGLFTVVNLASGEAWTPTSAPSHAWKAVACSADGNKLVAAGVNIGCGYGCIFHPIPIYTSTNSGATWTQTSAPSNLWSSVASSADGTKLVAVVGDRSKDWVGYVNYQVGEIYTSTDSGATWTQTSAPTTNWSSVASSADGTKIIAASGGRSGLGTPPGPIYTSTDTGATWTATSAPTSLWTSVATSADGTKLVAAIYSDEFGNAGLIYTSLDSGAIWGQTTAPSNYWSSVASAADGMKLVAAAESGEIYTSLDSGANWVQTTASTNYYWSSVASSADGTRLVAVPGSRYAYSYSDPIYTSSNSGATWTQTISASNNWSSVASSAEGSKLVAAAYTDEFGNYGLIYTTQSTSTPLLSIGRLGCNAVVSWLVPSTSFVLQQNSDLTTTNWTDVPTPPTFNFTNLHYEVIVSPSPGQRFYRLKQQ